MPNEATAGREARTFAAYLGSPRVPREIVERYQQVIEHWPQGRLDRFDAWLLRLAAGRSGLTSIADTYARLARPYGELRRRLTLMLALLETHGATHARYDRAHASGPVGAWLALAGVAALWALRSVVAVIVCGSAHIALGGKTPERGSV